ncbi:hypothetical protein T265_09984 [Opisthorchis viverrini]|uniref:Uncharacterized protein n=1 Tax=Opisthorchis viverrini TaxID=6198 RepID=A0A074ZET9_OPIVI|nr:hypothetical protein T265_09984 [Opisthorchis viverrini]KER21745.1 hypothetical protein T265_09984 [Opisthorchis viverrini]
MIVETQQSEESGTLRWITGDVRAIHDRHHDFRLAFACLCRQNFLNVELDLHTPSHEEFKQYLK